MKKHHGNEPSKNSRPLIENVRNTDQPFTFRLDLAASENAIVQQEQGAAGPLGEIEKPAEQQLVGEVSSEFARDMHEATLFVLSAMKKPQNEAEHNIIFEIAMLRSQLRKLQRDILNITSEILPVAVPNLKYKPAAKIYRHPIFNEEQLTIRLSFGEVNATVPIIGYRPKNSTVDELTALLKRNYIRLVISEHEKFFDQFKKHIKVIVDESTEKLDMPTKE